jgi:hypothetical protein
VKSFREWTRVDVEQVVKDARDAGYEANRLYVEERDHWQDGAGYIGPRPVLTSPRYNEGMIKIRSQFTIKDAIREVLGRLVNSLLRIEALLTFAPDRAVSAAEPVTPAEETQIADALNSMSWWWDLRKLHERLRDVVRQSRWAGRAYLRPWVPSGLLETQSVDGRDVGVVPAGDFEQQLERIHLEVPLPGQASIYTDPETQRPVALVTWLENDLHVAELSFVDDDGQTVIRSFRGDAEPTDYRLWLGGRLPLVEIGADILIDEAVRSQQRRLNFAETLLNRNLETAGFPERVITNAEPEGALVPVARAGLYPTRMVDGALHELQPVPRTLGAGVTSEIQGVKYYDAQRNEQIATPGVHWKDPVDPNLTIRAARHAYATILESCNQAHFLIASDAAASGVSREQARADFEDDLSRTKGVVEAAARELIDVVAALAAAFSQPSAREPQSPLTGLRTVVDLHVSSGPVGSADVQTGSDAVTAGNLSIETYLARIGVDDVDAELKRLADSDRYKAMMAKLQADALAALVGAGATLEGAALLLGIDAEAAAKLVPRDTTGPVKQ